MRAVHAVVVALATVAGAFTAPALAGTVDDWHAPVPLTRGGADVWDLGLSLADDRGVAAWVRWKDDRTRLLVARQRRDDSWSPPRVVRGTGRLAEVEVAADGRGWHGQRAGGC
ncbi:hypothetical protein GCM10011376_33400 [Nocardioides flavus (ex Wang et al. 2016)]|uniref:Uncharacterized protein n=1 Tax=Nocardioides flavus (ex Wang et al. 2016) TaxID=2058780 RepID=A0ABQ3HP42_9ACTN|nr:hypothetical protein [Nocardioides flavus (ex Wang et al. 2016)]GHE18730.1 hypothetical protein GCM10011376_33400 [Nocardioides flavus (ex Wang et al. 2016)]